MTERSGFCTSHNTPITTFWGVQFIDSSKAVRTVPKIFKSIPLLVNCFAIGKIRLMVEKFLTSGDNEFHYLEGGAGPTIVLIPSFGQTSFSYRKLAETLSRSFHVFLVDLPNFGGSKAPADSKTFDDFSNRLKDFVEALSLKSFTLVGFSLSGGIAIKFTAQHAGKVKMLVVCDSVGYPLKRGLFSFFSRMFVMLTKILMGGCFLVSAKIVSDFLLMCFRSPMQVVFEARMGASANLLKDAQRIKTKTLILWGDADYVIEPRYAKLLQKEISDSVLKQVSGGHMWFLVCPDTLRNEILEVL